LTAIANAMAESFVDTFKTELITDRVWRTNQQLELAIVQYVGWFNQARLHTMLGNRPPAEIEAEWHTQHGSKKERLSARTALTDQLSERLQLVSLTPRDLTTTNPLKTN
jgi:hypothetical protein